MTSQIRTVPTPRSRVRRRKAIGPDCCWECAQSLKEMGEDVNLVVGPLEPDSGNSDDPARRLAAIVNGLIEDIDLIDVFLIPGRKRRSTRRPEARLVLMLRRRLLQALATAEVEILDEATESVDYSICDVLQVVPTDDTALDGHVADVVQPGYRHGERLLRPIQVTVFKNPTHPKDQTE